MKKSLIAGIIALGCIMATNTDLHAQRTKNINSVEQIDKDKGSKAEKHKQMTEKMITELDLNKKQSKQVREINSSMAEEVKTIRNSKMPEALKKDKLKAIKANHYEQVSSVLTKKQRNDYDAFLERMRENRKEIKRSKNGKKNANATQRKGRVESIDKTNRSIEKSDAKSQKSAGKSGVKSNMGKGNINRGGEGNKNLNPDAMARSRTARMKSNLGLDANQEAAIFAINKTAAEETKILNNEMEDITRQEQLSRRARIENDANNQIMDVLNPEQKEKFEAYIAKRQQNRMKDRNGSGNTNTKPRPR